MLARAIDAVRWAQLRVAMLALAAMMLATVADVAMRHLAGRPILGAYAVVESCLAVFVFHGISATFAGRRNIVIDLIDAVAPRRVVAALAHAGDALGALCLLAAGWAMVEPMLQAAEYGDAKPQLGLPLAALWAMALLGLAGTALSALGALLAPVEPPRG